MPEGSDSAARDRHHRRGRDVGRHDGHSVRRSGRTACRFPTRASGASAAWRRRRDSASHDDAARGRRFPPLACFGARSGAANSRFSISTIASLRLPRLVLSARTSLSRCRARYIPHERGASSVAQLPRAQHGREIAYNGHSVRPAALHAAARRLPPSRGTRNLDAIAVRIGRPYTASPFGRRYGLRTDSRRRSVSFRRT